MRKTPRVPLAPLLAMLIFLAGLPGGRPTYALAATPASVPYWSLVAADTVKARFPGEAAVLMAITQATIYDTDVAVEGGAQPYAITLSAPANTSLDAAVASASRIILEYLVPEATVSLEGTYFAYLNMLPSDDATANGIVVGDTVATKMIELRTGDGRELIVPYTAQPFGPGVYEPTQAGTPLGTKLPYIRPLGLASASQFRPDGPSSLTSQEYADDVNELKAYGAKNSLVRTPDQTDIARFWTAHDVPQWERAMVGIASARGLSQAETARMLVVATIAAGDAMIACFDAKYHYNFWRPIDAIRHADIDGNPATDPDPTWEPLLPTPLHPEYPSAHGCHSGAIVEALTTYFGTDKITFTISSPALGVRQPVRSYKRLKDALKEVIDARVWAGFHFRNSDEQGASLGRRVARYVTGKLFGD